MAHVVKRSKEHRDRLKQTRGLRAMKRKAAIKDDADVKRRYRKRLKAI